MRLRLTVLALAALLTAGMVHAPAAQAQGTGFVTASALNVRTGPGTHFPVIGTFTYGQPVTVLQSAPGWFLVKGGFREGWVSAAYVDTRAAPVARPNKAEDIDVVSNPRRGRVNVFSGPGPEYDLVGVLENGVSVTVLERGPQWTLIAKRGLGRGYIRSNRLVD